MKLLERINPELLEILDRYRTWFDKQDDKHLLKCDDRRIQGHTVETACGNEYLESIISDNKHRGPPEVANVCDFQHCDVPEIHRKKSLDLCLELSAYLGAKFNAVHVYYPVGGFMGWHNNWDVPGYNILISYSEDEKGFFRYRDADTGDIVTMNDTKGWSCKVGYYGGKKESQDNHYWHCAGSFAPRQTLGFVIPNKEMWEMMIEDILD